MESSQTNSHQVTCKMPSSKPYRFLDYVFLGYFFLQIPSTILFDTQGVYPEWLYPQFMCNMRAHYLETYRDPFLANAWLHPWYLAVCLVEHYIEVPFFFWAAAAYYRGALNKPSVVVPSLIYSVHTVTAVTSIWFMALLQDFSQYEAQYGALAPRTIRERLTLCSAYAPFFFFPLSNIIDCAMLLAKRKRD